jgi:hypothetical protein
MAHCGGYGEAKVATAEEQAILDVVKGEISAKIGAVVEELVMSATHFKTQVVAGKRPEPRDPEPRVTSPSSVTLSALLFLRERSANAAQSQQTQR